MNTISLIRSVGLARINQLARVARHLEVLRPAFLEWAAGDIYVCKKTGDYRYRCGERSKSVAPWSQLARSLFPSPQALAFAAMVLAETQPAQLTLPAPREAAAGRIDVIALAEEGAQ